MYNFDLMKPKGLKIGVFIKNFFIYQVFFEIILIYNILKCCYDNSRFIIIILNIV